MGSDEAYPKPALNLNEKPPRRFEIPMSEMLKQILTDLEKTATGTGSPKSRAALADLETSWCAVAAAIYGGTWQMLPRKEGEIRFVQCRPQADAYASLPYPHKTMFETLESPQPHKSEHAKVFKAPSQLLVDMDDNFDVIGDLE